MEFRIQKSEFLKGLRLAQGIADRKSTMPILANVLLRTDGKSKLLLAATDLNVSVSSEISAKVEKEGGLTVSARHLHDVVAALPGEDVSFRRMENNRANVRAGKVEYKLVGMADRDFPKLPDHREVKYSKIEAFVLRDMIDKTLFSVSNDETRFHLSGVLFECDGERARMISTDGHRLTRVERPLSGGPTLPAGVIIPKKGLVEIKRSLDSHAETVEMGFASNHVFIKANELALALKLVESQFPPYEQVIPKSFTRKLILGRSDFFESIKRAQLLSSETRGVRFALEKNHLTISSENPELGDVKEEMDIAYEGEPLTIGFNPKYVLELLSQMVEAEIAIELSGELDPVAIRPVNGADYLGVVMPMRI